MSRPCREFLSPSEFSGGLTHAALTAALLAGSGAARPCGLEDPSSLPARRGMLNWIYPKALYVGTAVWQAQLAGLLVREPPVPGFVPEPMRGAAAVQDAGRLYQLWRARLDGSPGTALRPPPIAVVLLEHVLWTRLIPRQDPDGVTRVELHMEGPVSGDVILVTAMPVMRALAEGKMTVEEAQSLGLVRFYGNDDRTAAAAAWLRSADAWDHSAASPG